MVLLLHQYWYNWRSGRDNGCRTVAFGTPLDRKAQRWESGRVGPGVALSHLGWIPTKCLHLATANSVCGQSTCANQGLVKCHKHAGHITSVFSYSTYFSFYSQLSECSLTAVVWHLVRVPNIVILAYLENGLIHCHIDYMFSFQYIISIQSSIYCTRLESRHYS